MEASMSNVQMCLLIGIPTWAALIGILLDVIQFNSLNARLDIVDASFRRTDSRIKANLDIR
jgi:hypothetical protein